MLRLIMQTFLAATWRFFVSIVDWRTLLRKLSGKPIVDVVFITNMRDNVDRHRFLGLWHPKSGHFNGPRYWFGEISAQTRALDITTRDLMTKEGLKRAQKYFISAVKLAEKKGAKVILLAATTKRLFGKDGTRLKKLFPNLIFTIGDNGTMLLLRLETLRALSMANLRPGHCKIAILGPYGFLGEMMVQALRKEGFDLIGAGPNTAALKMIETKYGIKTCRDFSDMGKVDAVVACTHSEKIRLNAMNIEIIRRKESKLLVVDVAEPSNLCYREYQKCRDRVIRQDAGNSYAPKLKYVLGAITYKMFRLTRGVTFGCFAEAICIAAALKRGKDMRTIDWFFVNEENMRIVSQIFKVEGFTTPFPRCFGKPINSFDLSLMSKKEIHQGIWWKLAIDKITSFFFYV